MTRPYSFVNSESDSVDFGILVSVLATSPRHRCSYGRGATRARPRQYVRKTADWKYPPKRSRLGIMKKNTLARKDDGWWQSVWRTTVAVERQSAAVVMGRHSNVTAGESVNGSVYATVSLQQQQHLHTSAAPAPPRDPVGYNGGDGTGSATTGAAVTMLRRNGTTATPDRSASDYYYYYAYENGTETTAALFYPLNGTTAGRPDAPFEKSNCQWIPAQQSLFQFSNICFLTAFIVPRSYKLSVLSLR